MNILNEEKEIFEEVKQLLFSYDSFFKSKDITYTLELKKDEVFDLNYVSEIEIIFFHEGLFFDIIEFFIIYKGKLDVHKKNLKISLIKDFDSLLKKE
jgi:hypothetical protein